MALFTTETARAAAFKSHAPDSARFAPDIPPPPPAIIPQPTAIPSQPAQTVDEFASRRIQRVRTQLDRIDDLASVETDPVKLRNYADAAHRLAEQERVLAGRPLPGSRRPVPEGRRGRGAADEAAILEVPAFPVAPPIVTQVAAVLDQPTAQVPTRPLGWEYDDPTAVVPVVQPEPPLPGGVTP